MKRPSYQWYPGDWKRDTALQACSWEARCLWRDLLDLMHDGQPYGHLSINGRALRLEQIGSMVGLSVARVKAYLTELEEAGVPSQTPEGILYSRRMVRDEEVRERRAKGGALSQANPNVPRPKGPTEGTTGGPTEGYPSDHPSTHPPPHPSPGPPPPSLGGSPAVAVAFASAVNNDDDIRAGALSGPMDPAGSSALQGYVRASHDPGRLLSELEAIVSGLHGPGGKPVPAKALGRALHAMQMVGVQKISPKTLLAFCRRELEPDEPPSESKAADDPQGLSEDLRGWVARREAQERARN